MNGVDIDTVISTLVNEYVETNSAYDEAVKSEEESDYDYENTVERLRLAGVIDGLIFALHVLGQDISKIDSQFSIDGV